MNSKGLTQHSWVYIALRKTQFRCSLEEYDENPGLGSTWGGQRDLVSSFITGITRVTTCIILV